MRVPRPARFAGPVAPFAIALALTIAAVAPQATLAAPGPPPLDASTDNPTTQVDPDLVVPTDTEVEPPAPDFEPPAYPYHYGQGSYRVNGPNVLWGSLLWQHTATGPASGVRVTYTRQQDGWRFSTTTDDRGRFRVAVPDGTYALSAADRRLEHGLVSPRSEGGWLVSGVETWNGGRGTGVPGVGVSPRPATSCTTAYGDVIEGWDDPSPRRSSPAPPCPYAGAGPGLTGTGLTFFWGDWFGTYPETGRDGAILSYMVPPKVAGAAATPAATARPTTPAPRALGVPRLPRTIQLSARHRTSIAVRCPTGTTCAGTLRLTTAPATRSRAARAGATLAQGTLRAERRAVALRVTSRGRRTAGARARTATVTWTPAGGSPAPAATVRLRIGVR
jgi:hypothetical protein